MSQAQAVVQKDGTTLYQIYLTGKQVDVAAEKFNLTFGPAPIPSSLVEHYEAAKAKGDAGMVKIMEDLILDDSYSVATFTIKHHGNIYDIEAEDFYFDDEYNLTLYFIEQEEWEVVCDTFNFCKELCHA